MSDTIKQPRCLMFHSVKWTKKIKENRIKISEQIMINNFLIGNRWFNGDMATTFSEPYTLLDKNSRHGNWLNT